MAQQVLVRMVVSKSSCLLRPCKGNRVSEDGPTRSYREAEARRSFRQLLRSMARAGMAAANESAHWPAEAFRSCRPRLRSKAELVWADEEHRSRSEVTDPAWWVRHPRSKVEAGSVDAEGESH